MPTKETRKRYIYKIDCQSEKRRDDLRRLCKLLAEENDQTVYDFVLDLVQGCLFAEEVLNEDFVLKTWKGCIFAKEETK